MLEEGERGFHAWGRRCLDSPILSSKRRLTGFTGITKPSWQQETSVSETEMKKEAEERNKPYIRTL